MAQFFIVHVHVLSSDDLLDDVFEQVGYVGIGLDLIYDDRIWMRGGIPLAKGGVHDVVDVFRDNAASRQTKIREQLDAAYGTPEITIKLTSMLTDLASAIPDMAERVYYQEALICYKYGSRRGAVVSPQC